MNLERRILLQMQQRSKEMCSIEKQKKDLEKFFFDCVRFWERFLKISADESKEPYQRALDDLPQCNPFVIDGREPFNEGVLREFKRYRLMDTYGNDWEKHWDEHASFIKKEKSGN